MTKKQEKNKSNNNLFLFLLIIFSALVLFFLSQKINNRQALIHSKPKLLCDNVENCSHASPSSMPRGVCAPGGKCSS
ncbi:MAG TPA: hypothetical protein VG965_06170 [Patescibacteria group bacterium]|nr:hypothetical protein [Patescibacteria group bacterium]